MASGIMVTEDDNGHSYAKCEQGKYQKQSHKTSIFICKK